MKGLIKELDFVNKTPLGAHYMCYVKCYGFMVRFMTMLKSTTYQPDHVLANLL